jgi:hypothetical protein
MAAVDDVRDGPGDAGAKVATTGAPATRPGRGDRRRLHVARLPLMAVGIVTLVTAVYGGLIRLGLPLPQVTATLVAFHGPLLVAGFLGTVIGMERAVALGRRWAYGGPLATGLGAVGLIVGVAGAPIALVVGSAWLVAVFVAVLRRQWALPPAVMAAGAVAWLVGQALWVAGAPLHRVVPWWMAFLTLTIAGERLELARLADLARESRHAFLVAGGGIVAGLVLGLTAPDAGARLLGAALVALAVWLGRHDLARRTVRLPGLTRFVAVALLSGYVWLGVTGLLALRFGAVAAGTAYDAILHALFVGFVFSMIFGHAPIIFPAVLGPLVAYRPAFYVHLTLLHVGLVARVVGDLAGIAELRLAGGVLNALAIGVFLVNTVYGIVRPPRRGPRCNGR